MEEFFEVLSSKYDTDKNFRVVCPSSLNNPKDNSVMFITADHINEWIKLCKVKNCIVIWPESFDVPNDVKNKHVVIKYPDPRQGFAMFFYENNIVYNNELDEWHFENGVYICNGAKIGKNVKIFPGAYIGAHVTIGDNCYIGSGVRLIGNVKIGKDVIIRENAVIGSDGLTTMRNNEGKIITIPQFGGVTIEDNVQIGAMTVIAKGAIDDTVIHSGCRIDNSCFISHNVQLGEDSLIVGETIMFGSSSTGREVYISGNSTIREGVFIGEKTLIGMGSVVTKTVAAGKIVKGNPAK